MVEMLLTSSLIKFYYRSTETNDGSEDVIERLRQRRSSMTLRYLEELEQRQRELEIFNTRRERYIDQDKQIYKAIPVQNPPSIFA